MATIGIVTAIANPALEAVVIRVLSSAAEDLQVVRRCVEVSDVLAIAASGQARAVVIGDNLAGMDADVIARIASYGVVPIALAEPDRSWPVSYAVPVVLDATADPQSLATRIAQAARAGVVTPPARPVEAERAPAAPGTAPSGPGTKGRVIAVWGPTGAPGRSTVALGVADEISRLGHSTMLVDADPYGGAQGAMLGLLDESPGIAAACRAASAGTLDTPSLARTCLQLSAQLRVLSGITRSDRWPELRSAAIETVLTQARALAAVTVVDCGFSIEEDEELTYDTLAPRRNGATTTVLHAADDILLVSGCDPVGVSRGIRAAHELRDLIPSAVPQVIVNKVRSGVLSGDAPGQLADAFERYAGLRVAHLLPMDVKAVDAALQRGRTLADVARTSGLRKAIARLAGTLAPVPEPAQQAAPKPASKLAVGRGRASRARRAAPGR